MLAISIKNDYNNDYNKIYEHTKQNVVLLMIEGNIETEHEFVIDVAEGELFIR